MNKIIKTLIYSDEVSLVAMDCTDMVNEAIKIHSLSADSARVFGKAIMAVTYMSAWLKDSSGEISANIKGGGSGGTICISGDSSLNMRGTMSFPSAMGSEREIIGDGYMTVVRDDAYAVPFVGTVPVGEEKTEDIFSEYYLISEQLPTHIFEEVRIGENGRCSVAFAFFLQPMPFSSAEAKKKAVACAENMRLPYEESAKGKIEKWVKSSFDCSAYTERNAEYKCRCSKDKISSLLLSMPRNEAEDIIKKEGKISVHCHYCNTDYCFTQADIDKLFSEKR